MMNTKRRYQRVPARFSRKTRFELMPRFESLTGDLARQEFEQLKARLLERVLQETSEPGLRKQLVLAANEAAAAAWNTTFPLLTLPVLLREKADEVHQYALRQEQVHQASQAFTPEAV